MSAAQPRLSTYLTIYVLLLVGLAATVGAAFIQLGPFNILVAMTIALAKAALVVLFFMHVLYSPRLTWLAVGAGIVWLAIMLALMIADPLSRDWIPLRAPANLTSPTGARTFDPPREADSPGDLEGSPHAEENSRETN